MDLRLVSRFISSFGWSKAGAEEEAASRFSGAAGNGASVQSGFS